MFGFRRKRKKNSNPDVPKSKPYQPKSNVNSSHLTNWTHKNPKREMTTEKTMPTEASIPDTRERLGLKDDRLEQLKRREW